MIVFIMVVNCFILGTIQSFAHDAILNVDYDDCIPGNNFDGIDEIWYVLHWGTSGKYYHYPDEENTIRYYFEESSSDGYTWTTDASTEEAQEIKNAYANSMKKWNNVYFYSYNSSGEVEKHKVINIVEGTASNHNLSIYPMSQTENYADTTAIDCSGFGYHNHCSEWKMRVSVPYFLEENSSAGLIDTLKNRLGAHEFGHVLGLWDVDNDNRYHAGNQDEGRHHHEILMGYGSPTTARAIDITYKDIAGVAITRGFHTDEDHKWLNAGVQSNGQYKLICSICNGVKTVRSLSGYSYSTYGACGNAHTVASGNMMAVASYKNRDYHKCRYCRYVAPFYSTVTQHYNKTNVDSQKHRCVNTVPGLGYTFYEAHINERYTTYDDTYHYPECACGHTAPKQKHLVQPTGPRYGICMVCNNEVPIGNGTILPWGNGGANVDGIFGFEGQILTGNGSYMLPNGVIVLAPADVDAYLKGELILPEDFSEYPTE